MQIAELFASDVTRDIPPVVYFHEQSPDKLSAEVSEYIITGGWPQEHPNHRRVPSGIHEQYVRLLTSIAAELDKPGGPELPTAWISGFYGSGKSSFAKLLGLALDGVELPGGKSLAQAWLERNTSPRAAELSEAWRLLRQKIDPLAVVFDIGSVARDNEHLHAATVRQVQRRLGYCSTEPLVAHFELRLERDGEWARFERTAQDVLGAPWAEVKTRALAEEDFSLVMSVMYPDRYTDPMSWYTSRGGTDLRADSPEDAVAALRDMLRFRRPNATLFVVIDEVSQYVLSNRDRVDRLRAFATALGSTLKGKAWLLALGQQKLDEEADDSFLVWAKDRFPPKLRVHLANTNIRDVVHKRLLHKRPDVEAALRARFEHARADLKLYAYGCEAVTVEELVEVYPMLPGQIDLILQITSALRTRSSRVQGDDQAIRGLLQLLGELFRTQKLAQMPVGALVTIDQVYDVQHTALDSDTQGSMARLLSQTAHDSDPLLVRSAKAVAMLELIQDTVPTDAKLVAQCLYDHIDLGNRVPEVTAALEELRRRNLLAYSEKLGYKIQSGAGEEWERERRDQSAPREAVCEVVQEGLKLLIATPEQPRMKGRNFPLAGHFSDGRRHVDTQFITSHDHAALHLDFRYVPAEDRTESTWVKRSAEDALHNRLVWVVGNTEQMDELARELCRSRAMVNKYKPRRESLSPARKMLLQDDENRSEELEKRTQEAIAAAWMAGKLYFRGRAISPSEQGASFATALNTMANRVLPDLFPHFTPMQIEPKELAQLLAPDLSGPSHKFLSAGLGILELDSGKYAPTASGVLPRRIQEHIEAEQGLGGNTLLAHFGGPPYGYTVGVVKACVAGLLRAGKLRVQTEGGAEITAIRDAGVRDVFEKDQTFRRATLLPAGQDDIGPQSRARICKFFEEHLQHTMDRDDNAIADAVSTHFPALAQKLRAVLAALDKLPGSPAPPAVFEQLGQALEHGVRICRQTKPTVKLVKKHLDALRDGVQLLHIVHAELTPDALAAVQRANEVLTHNAAQLTAVGVEPSNVQAAAARIRAQLESEKPWRGIQALQDDLAEVRRCYEAERQRLLERQEQQAEAARARVKGRQGFSTLTADQSHRVLRPLATATTNTTAQAIAPPLDALQAPFAQALERAEEHANEELDKLLSQGDKPVIRRVDLRLQNREVATEADVDALVDEIKNRLLEHIRAGGRVRLL
jgi:hypothetical protein